MHNFHKIKIIFSFRGCLSGILFYLGISFIVKEKYTFSLPMHVFGLFNELHVPLQINRDFSDFYWDFYTVVWYSECKLIGRNYKGVRTTCHSATEAGSCQLPKGKYVSNIHPVALGNIKSLGKLKYNPGLCGHILTVNCGKGNVDIIVSNANLGNGLDLYASSWKLATKGKDPGEESCRVQLTNKNPLRAKGPRCYYAPESETNNPFYHLLGIFNTGGRIVKSAKLSEKHGKFNSLTAYFAFHGGPVKKDASLKFQFTDGSTHKMKLKDCIKEKKKQIWH